MEKVATIDTMLGPSIVSFTSNGSIAFVAAGKEARVDKINTTSRQIVASKAVPAPCDQLLATSRSKLWAGA